MGRRRNCSQAEIVSLSLPPLPGRSELYGPIIEPLKMLVMMECQHNPII